MSHEGKLDCVHLGDISPPFGAEVRADSLARCLWNRPASFSSEGLLGGEKAVDGQGGRQGGGCLTEPLEWVPLGSNLRLPYAHWHFYTADSSW